MREINLDLILFRMRAGWRTPVIFAVLAIMCTLYTLSQARAVYHVEMTVLPAPGDQGMQAPVGGAIGSLLGISNGNNGNDYTRYQRLITSAAVAQRMQDHYRILQEIFADQWDSTEHRWAQPKTLRSSLLGWLFALSHVPVWTPPDVTALSRFLQGGLTIIPSPTSDLVIITMDSPDPAFAKRILMLAHTEANGLLRDQVGRRSREQAQYLEAKLAQTTVADYRASLIALLSTQQKTLMMTQTGADFAAEIVGPPVASPTPISPRPLLSLAVAALVGVLIGFAVTIFLGPDWWHRGIALVMGRFSAMRRSNNDPAKQA
jgi:uncharacterized protein involved in exopolysaccharide biosynthesis